MYVEDTEKEMKTAMYLLKTEADAGVQKMKEEVVLNESELAASSRMSKKGRTVIGKLVKAVALVCSTFGEDFSNAVVEHELGVAEDLTERGDFLLAESSKNL